MSRDPQVAAHDWGRLIQFVVGPDDDRHRDAGLALAMSLGSAFAEGSLACSVTQVTSSGYRTPVWSTELALDLDQAQYDSGEGPCVAAARDGQVHSIRVLVDEPKYQAFTAAAVQRGVACSLSLPLSTRATPGALNLYARTTSAYDSGRARATAELLAHCVGALLDDRDGGRKPGLGRALARRELIERAEAELIRQGAADETAAYVRMTRLSVSENRSIAAVAADLVGAGSAGRGGSSPADQTA